jgi:amino acid transporter
MVTLPLEIVAAAITIQYWDSPVSSAVWVTIFLLLIVGINLLGVSGFGEAEFYFSLLKILAIVGFMFVPLPSPSPPFPLFQTNFESILGIILDCGGGPTHDHIGGRYWHNPGAFNSGFKGLCSVFVTAAFAFSGTELVGLAAAETEDVRRSLPRAVKLVFWRISGVSALGCGKGEG